MSTRFVLLRHGESQANVQHVIAGRPGNATAAYGLTDLGRRQVRESIQDAAAAGLVPRGSLVVTSPLLRARESAAIAAGVLDGGVRVDVRLTERGFGSLELGPDDAYAEVWDADRADTAHRRWGVESVRAVLERGTDLLSELDGGARKVAGRGHEGDAGSASGRGRDGGAETILLCTHGDVASVLYCASLGLSPGRHREVGTLGTAELRLLGPEPPL